jgi:hypothetical protein
MPASLCLFGERRAGYILMTRVVGSSGIVGIIWGAGMKMTNGKSKDGKL